jgi:ParB/RepB/Spo0J family partition protein
VDIDLHQLELRFEALRTKSVKKERRLMASLAAVGQQLPVVVVRAEDSSRYVVVDGYKRVRALRKLRRDRALTTVWELEQSDALVLEQLMRRGESDSPIQQGWLLVELQERFGVSQEELARRFDKSPSWVSRRLALVRALPMPIQSWVREGALSSYIATKLLVPMARAKPDDACRLAEVMARLELSTRDAHRLHTGYLQCGARGRELLLEQPEVYLRAEIEAARPLSESPSPIEQVAGELDSLASMARRTFRRLEDGRLRRALSPDRDHVERMARVAQRRVQELFERIDSELSHAGPEHS